MKKLTIIIFCLIIPQLCFSQTGWIRQYSGLYENNLKLSSVIFLNPDTGFIVGWKPPTDSIVILKTSNGGANWQAQYFLNYSMHERCITFINTNTGFITADSCRLIKTTNGGISWNIFNIGLNIFNQNMFNIKFLNESTGFATLMQNIIRTTNSGTNWTISNILGGPTSLEMLTNTFFLNDSVGFLCGLYSIFVPSFRYEGVIYKTTNSGIDWSYLYSNYTNLLNITFNNSNTGFAFGVNNNNGYYKTTNSGNSWSNFLFSGYSDHAVFNGISINNSNYIVGTIFGYIAYVSKSTNLGANWEDILLVNGPYYIFSGIHFIDSITGWVVGYPGLIYKTISGGTGILHNSEHLPSSFSLSQNYPNPFNPSTNIRYQVESYKVIKLVVYDILGKEVVVLVNEKQSPGTYEVNWEASAFPSGVYFYKLTAEDPLLRSVFNETRRMVLTK
jgi:photosystem II stability/assembly factor-like uncharacterized protein